MAALPLKAVERILRKAGAKRVSKSAAEEFSKFLEELAGEIAADAAQLAQHSGRVTVTEKDVQMVRKIRKAGR
jgi:histone H3/H4